MARGDSKMLSDAIDIADSTVRSDIESFCRTLDLAEVTVDASVVRTWYDTSDPKHGEWMPQYLRYADARDLLIRHPQQPHLVRFG